MQGLGLLLLGAGLAILGIFFLVRAESVVNFFYGETNTFSETLVSSAVTFVRIMGLFLLFVFIVLLCGIWANE